MNQSFELHIKHYFIPAACPCCGEKIFLVTDIEGNIIDLIPLKGIEEVMNEETQKNV